MNIEIHYACDDAGDYTAPLTSCTTSKVRQFEEQEKALEFVEKCSYVYNLDTILEVIPYEEVPNVLDKVADKIIN